MSETKTYEGSCHCGAVKFTVTMEPPAKAYACNCSLCKRAGWLLAFAPASGFHLASGEGELTDYQFNKKKLHHTFCKTCGVRSFSRGPSHDGSPTVAVNLRCLADFDATALPVQAFDGAKL
jgi:hypothetical protein